MKHSSEADYIFCGSDKLPSITSDRSVLTLVFDSGTTEGPGFKAVYFFEIDYRINGTPEPPKCKFKYSSDTVKEGKFNSPRYPHNYFLSTTCEYLFIAAADENIEITFTEFQIVSINDNVRLAYNEECSEDWIEIYEIHNNGKEYKLGRYCNYSAPGPYISPSSVNQVQVIFNSDDKYTSSGFSAIYNFTTKKDALDGKRYFAITGKAEK